MVGLGFRRSFITRDVAGAIRFRTGGGKRTFHDFLARSIFNIPTAWPFISDASEHLDKPYVIAALGPLLPCFNLSLTATVAWQESSPLLPSLFSGLLPINLQPRICHHPARKLLQRPGSPNTPDDGH
jgi:hypothetical protein